MSGAVGACRFAKQATIDTYAYANDGLVDAVDWRAEGVVGPIKNQHPHNAPVSLCPSVPPPPPTSAGDASHCVQACALVCETSNVMRLSSQSAAA